MTGIERLYKLIADINVSADPELWYILRGGTEGDWDCEKHDDKTLGSTLAAIADQIEREQGGRVSRMRVLSVVMEMERHVSGVEGMEDSPVARWARELREALGDDVRDPAADVSVSVYDLLSSDERNALAWVRDHGGIDYVKAEWRSRVPRERYEAGRQRLLGHIAECETALGRRCEIISRLTHRVSDLMTENAELRKRAMPEGMEWPRYEDDEPVSIGDEVDFGGEGGAASSVELQDDGHFVIHACDGAGDYSHRNFRPGERVKRPSVLAADGEPLEVGQTVWDTNGDELVIGALEDGGHTVTCRYADVGDGMPVHGMWSPSDLTHQRPVLDADGVPIKVGDTVWPKYPYEEPDRQVESAEVLYVHRLGRIDIQAKYATGLSFRQQVDAKQLTHTKPEPPDSLERIADEIDRLREEVALHLGDYLYDEDGNDSIQFSMELVAKRCRALAERERGE